MQLCRLSEPSLRRLGRKNGGVRRAAVMVRSRMRSAEGAQQRPGRGQIGGLESLGELEPASIRHWHRRRLNGLSAVGY